eukprot:Rmarinus@m.27787
MLSKENVQQRNCMKWRQQTCRNNINVITFYLSEFLDFSFLFFFPMISSFTSLLPCFLIFSSSFLPFFLSYFSSSFLSYFFFRPLFCFLSYIRTFFHLVCW